MPVGAAATSPHRQDREYGMQHRQVRSLWHILPSHRPVRMRLSELSCIGLGQRLDFA